MANEITTVPEYLEQVIPKLYVLPESVVLPTSEVNTEDNTKTVTGGAIETEQFDCTKVNLKEGSKGDDVKKLQTILKSKGLYSRQIDGDFGKYTTEGVKALQGQLELNKTGTFDKETCEKLQGTTNTTSNAKKQETDQYLILDFKGDPQITYDMEALSQEITVTTPFTQEKLSRLQRLRKTRYELYKGDIPCLTHEGYINDVKIAQDDDRFYIELQLVGYNVFLEQSIEYERTGLQSEILLDLAEQGGFELILDLTGLKDESVTVTSKKAEGSSSSADGGLTNMSGNDCSETFDISTRSYDIGKTASNKIGNSSANYATDTSSMSGKDAIMDIFNRFKYKGYANNRTCPQKMWNSGTIRGNCADISRLIMCVGQVHGMTVGIHHMSGHYYNLIEVGGKTYRFDACCKSTGKYHGEITNTLTMRGGPW